MKFLLDESADYSLAAFLRALGHDVTAIAHDYPQALADSTVLALARQEQRTLITNDHDFGELIFRQHMSHHGVILFRLGAESLRIKSDWLAHVLRYHVLDLQHFLVITDRGVRVRRTVSR